jgi:hypothetical protein
MNPTKLVLHFSYFCHFLRNLQESANPKYYLSCDFADRLLIPFDSYAEAPTLQLAPWKETQPCNVTLMRAVAGAVGKIRRGPPESRPGKGVRRGNGHWRLGFWPEFRSGRLRG